MIIPTADSHPFGCYWCGWVKAWEDDDCLCTFEREGEE